MSKERVEIAKVRNQLCRTGITQDVFVVRGRPEVAQSQSQLDCGVRVAVGIANEGAVVEFAAVANPRVPAARVMSRAHGRRQQTRQEHLPPQLPPWPA